MTFDPATFLNQDITEALDTKVIPCPVGEYVALAEKVEVKPWQTKDGSSSGLKLVVIWDIQDENAKAATSRDPLRVKQEQMLDLTDAGNLDLGKGRNVGLGRLREALKLNNPGESFNFGMIQGRIAKVKVTHRPSGEDLYDEIKAVTSAE